MGFLNNPWNVLIVCLAALAALAMVLLFVQHGGKITAGKAGVEIDDETPEAPK